MSTDGRSCVLVDAPDWRWQQALYERQREREDSRDFVASTDLTVRLAKRFLEVWEDPELQGASCRELLPGFSFIHDLYMEKSPGCTKHALEAAILAGAVPEFIVEKIHPRLTSFVTRLYELVYFDVRERMESPFWVEKYIFAPALAEDKAEVRASNLVWKLIGYYGGPDRLLKDCLRGKSYSGKDMDWLMEHIVSQDAREALKFVHSGDRLPKEISAPAHQRTVDRMVEDRISRIKEMSGQLDDGKTIPSEKISFGRYMKMSGADEKLGKTEKLEGSTLKYSDGDLTR